MTSLAGGSCEAVSSSSISQLEMRKLFQKFLREVFEEKVVGKVRKEREKWKGEARIDSTRVFVDGIR